MSLNKPTINCPLVFACDPDFAMPLATTLLSIAEANWRAWPLQIYVLSCGFADNVKAKIIGSIPQGSCSITWIPVALTAFARFSTLRHISSATYARLLITNILPKEISRVLYLDADILVLDDLSPVCEMDLDGAVFGAVVDERINAHIRMGKTSLGGMSLPRVQDYFNAGVLLIDLTKWKIARVQEKAMEYLELYPHSAFSDQDALNFACDGAWKRLDPRWNYYQIELKKPISDLSEEQRPGIIHFQGWSKPWDPSTFNSNAKYYDSFRSRTLFALTPGEKWRQAPIAMWSRLKSILRRFTTVRYIRNQLKRSSRNEANVARRLSA